MRRLIASATAVCGLVLFSATANAQTRGGHIEGFGGTTFGTTTNAPTFGGSIAVPLGDYIQIIGEGGRLTDINHGLRWPNLRTGRRPLSEEELAAILGLPLSRPDPRTISQIQHRRC